MGGGMMRGMIAGLVSALLVFGSSVAMAQEPEGDVAAFRRLRAEGLAAARADDLVTASARLAEADARIPNHPGLMMLRGRLAMAMDDPVEALIHYGRYGAAGLVFNVETDTAFADLAARPEQAAAAAVIAGLIKESQQPVGEGALVPLFELDGPVLAESLVRDETQGRWLVSQIAGRTIVSISDDGTVSPWLEPHPAVSGVVGLALDEARGILWATTAPLPPAVYGRSDEAPPTALLQIDLEAGRVLRLYPVPADDREHGLGDLALMPDGAVVVSDGQSGDLYRLAAPDQSLTPFVTGVFGSPQGLAVVRLVLYPNHEEVAFFTVLAANLPEIGEPTSATVFDGQLVFVSRSQWNGFDQDGAARQTDLPPALISRLPLTPEP